MQDVARLVGPAGVVLSKCSASCWLLPWQGRSTCWPKGNGEAPRKCTEGHSGVSGAGEQFGQSMCICQSTYPITALQRQWQYCQHCHWIRCTAVAEKPLVEFMQSGSTKTVTQTLTFDVQIWTFLRRSAFLKSILLRSTMVTSCDWYIDKGRCLIF